MADGAEQGVSAELDGFQQFELSLVVLVDIDHAVEADGEMLLVSSHRDLLLHEGSQADGLVEVEGAAEFVDVGICLSTDCQHLVVVGEDNRSDLIADIDSFIQPEFSSVVLEDICLTT